MRIQEVYDKLNTCDKTWSWTWVWCKIQMQASSNTDSISIPDSANMHQKTHLPLYYTLVHPYADVVSVYDNTLDAYVHIVNRLRLAMKYDLPKQYRTDR